MKKSGLSRLGADLRTPRARNVMAAVVVPLIAALVLGRILMEFPPILPGLLVMAVCLATGFVFLYRAFRLYAILFSWAYFFVMYWLIVAAGIVVGETYLNPSR